MEISPPLKACTCIKSSMLGNVKYKGDALLQKTFCEDFLTKKMKTNQGEGPAVLRGE